MLFKIDNVRQILGDDPGSGPRHEVSRLYQKIIRISKSMV